MEKAYHSILVTLLPNEMELKEEQYQKASSPMLTSQSCNVTEVRLELLKAPRPIVVTLAGPVRDVRLVQLANAYSPKLFNRLPSAYEIEVRPEHPLKALSPMLITLLGIVMDVRPVH